LSNGPVYDGEFS